MNWTPIRKIVVGLITSGVVYAAHRVLGLDLGSDAVTEAVIPAVGFVASYLVRDPRVASAVDTLDHSAIAAEVEGIVLDAIEPLVERIEAKANAATK